MWALLYEAKPPDNTTVVQFYCDGDLQAELDYSRRIQAKIVDERGTPPIDLRSLVEEVRWHYRPDPLRDAIEEIAENMAMAPVVAPAPIAGSIEVVDRASHTCHRPGCDDPCPPKHLACRPHWFELLRGAPDLAAEIKKTFRLGQEVDKKPSVEYIAAMNAARDWWLAKDAAKRVEVNGDVN